MISKIFPFNKTLFKKDWKIIGWWSYLATAMLFLMAPMHNLRILNRIQELRDGIAAAGSPERLHDVEEVIIARFGKSVEWYIDYGFKGVFSFREDLGQWVLLLVFPLLIAVILIGEERRKKTFDFLSIIPYTRGKIFFNKIAVGFLALILPYAVNGPLMYLMRYAHEYIGNGYTAADVSRWMLAFIVSMSAVFAFGIFIGMIAGSSLAHLTLAGILLWFPLGFVGLMYINLFFWGVSYDFIHKLLDMVGVISIPAYFFEMQFLDKEFPYRILVLLLFAVVSIILAKVLFDRNKMERNGEVLMFGNLEKLFRYGATICTMLLFGPFFGIVIFSGLIVSERSLVGGIVGYIIGAVFAWFTAGYLIAKNRAEA